METEFRLKIVNIRENLEQGDITKIALSAGVSIVTVQKMFKTQVFDDLTPAMKRALNTAIDFVEQKKIRNNEQLDKILRL